MPHVELSLTEDASRLGAASGVHPHEWKDAPHEWNGAPPAWPDAPAEAAGLDGNLARWAAAAACADEPSLVLGADSIIIAASPACAELIGLGDPATAVGRPLRDAVADLVDFTDPPAQLDSGEADKIPPLLAIASGQLARGLMRVACRVTGTPCMMDAVSTPLWEDGTVAGSLTFFSKI